MAQVLCKGLEYKTSMIMCVSTKITEARFLLTITVVKWVIQKNISGHCIATHILKVKITKYKYNYLLL